MNFTDFSFWWWLLLMAIPLLGIRYLGQLFKMLPSSYDRIGLMLVSLILF